MNTAPSGSVAAILATAVIPWTERHEFDEDRFCQQVHTIARGLTRHIYVFGTAGEGYAVSEGQFDRIVAAFWRSAREAEVSPTVGIISLSLPCIIDRIERACALGFREFQLSLPCWGALNDRELDNFFVETCGRFPTCWFQHYNLTRARRVLTAAEYRRLADAHPNFVAVKATTHDPGRIADLLRVTPRLRLYFTELGYVIARRTHEVGLLASLATVNPTEARALVEGDDHQRAAAAADFRAMLDVLLKLAAGRYHMDGAFDKMLVRFSDRDFPLRLLPPYASATEEDFARFEAALPARWRRNPA